MSRKSHVESLERKINELRAVSKKLQEGNAMLDELWNLIHRPGWTTLPEATLVEAILESQTKHAQTAYELMKSLMSAAAKVELNPQPLPP